MMFRLAVRTAALAYVGLGLGLSSYVKKNDISPLSCRVNLTSDTAVGYVVMIIHLFGGTYSLCSRT
jgi:hypothetical protein